MDVANAVAAPTANLYMLDLVSFKSKYCIILSSSTWLSHPADELSMLRFDGQPLTKEAGDTDVVLIDRSFLHVGQAVVSASDIAGQIGVVTGVTTTLDLVDRATGEVIRGLPPSALQRVRALCLGDYVVYGQGQWLGRVVEVSLDVDVMFDDGAVCRITDAESPTKQLWPPESGSGLHRKQTNTSFYPGLPITSGDPSIVFKGARWLSGHWNKRREQVGTVTKVEMAGVLVRWIASAYGDTDEQFLHESAPPAYLSPENLTYFCPAYGCSWAVGDHCFLRESESSLLAAASASSEMDAIHDQRQQSSLQSDDSSSSDEEEHVEPWSPSLIVGSETAPEEEKRDYRKQLRKPMFIGQRGRARQSYQWSAPLRTLTVSCTRTTIDVLWQDGSRQHEVPSTYLNPFEMMNEHEVFPGQYVIDARDDGVTGESTGRRVGVVKNLNSKDYTAHVSWFKAASDSWEVECGDEAISVYDLGSDPNHTIFYGDVVVRTISSNMRGNAPQPQSQASDLSWVGHVVDFCDGHIQVKWGDDTMSMVLPHEISVASKEHYSQLEAEMGDWVEEDGVDTHQETGAADVDNDPADATNIQGGRVEHGGSSANESDGSAAATGTNRLAGVIRSMILSVVQTLAGAKLYLVNIGSSSTSDLPAATMQDVVQVPAHVSVSGSHEYHSIGGAATEAVLALVARNNENGDGDVEDAVRSGEAVTGDDDKLKFPNFDIVKTPTDHHYLDTMNQGSGGNRWVKKVQKEWKILEESLPDTIYVRAYEDRMDLLRVAMVGASGTPYQHGLFFFDLQLPPSYPAVPPQVYYRSFGLRVNPNLYPSGTVCLSLLNTFGGEGTEVWSPGTSSLLQVVVSLQALVLNDQPYYNEAGHDALVDTPEGHRNALPYSENAFLLTLRTALHLLRQPPRGFEGFITDHFHERGRLVLAACEGYLRGCVPNAHEGGMELPCTTGFRIALANLVPRLMAAFTLKDTTTSDTKKVSQVKL